MLKMVPIGKETQLCALLGSNAFDAPELAYINGLFIAQKRDIAAIALNVRAEHFALTLSNLATSKLTKVVVLDEYASACLPYCDILDADATRFGRVHALHSCEGKLYGYNLHAQALVAAQTLAITPDDDVGMKILRLSAIAQMWFETTMPDTTMLDTIKGAKNDQPR